jgi:two-component system, NarL family, sensor histidine kinase UhpB
MQRARHIDAKTPEVRPLAIHPGRKQGGTLRPDSVTPRNLPNSILRAEENERKRIARELHDEMGQGLMALRFYLGALLRQAADGPLKPRAEEAMALLDETIEGLRRIIGSLSPKPLENLGLIGAIRKEVTALSRQTGMKSHLAFPRELGFLAGDIELAIYRSVQEALNNISKHSGAHHFGVSIELRDGCLMLRIDDDGRGFSGKVTASEGFGVKGMNARIKELGGSLRIRSRKGGGTIIDIEIPLASGNTHKNLRDVAPSARAS